LQGDAPDDVQDLRSLRSPTGLTRRYGLGQGQREQLAILLDNLALAGAPTAVHSLEQALDAHVADALVALELGVVRKARTIADLGSGAGLPGVPLAVALADSEVRLIESQARKCLFLEDLLAAARVENARVVCARAEEWREGLEGNDLIVARALAPQPVVLEYAAPLLRRGGAVVDWRGKRVAEEERAAERAAEQLGLRRAEVLRVQPFEEARDRHLHVYLKIRETPARFPRRAGMARKRPLASFDRDRR
jgi:16S rRNA (guanine527-N7)-methyltransferase